MTQFSCGRLVLVVGGSGGIGAATARLFAVAGARVASRHTAIGDRRSRLLAITPRRGHLALPADVADTASLRALRDAVRALGRRAACPGQCGRLHEPRAARRPGCTGRCADRQDVRGQLARPVRIDPHLRADADGLR